MEKNKIENDFPKMFHILQKPNSTTKKLTLTILQLRDKCLVITTYDLVSYLRDSKGRFYFVVLLFGSRNI